MKKELLCASIILACGCGGSSGSSDPSFAGIWKADFPIAEDTCEPERMGFEDEWSVNEMDGVISLDGLYGSYRGSATGPNGFSVTFTSRLQCFDSDGNEVPSSTAIFTDTFQIENFDGTSGQVTNTETYTDCSGNPGIDVSCRYLAQGSATKISG